MSRATSRNTVPSCRGASSQPGSSSRVTPTQVAAGASSGRRAGAVTASASFTSADRNGPITARASGSAAAFSAAPTGSSSPCATCAIPAPLSTSSTAAVKSGGRIEWTATTADGTSPRPGEQVRQRIDRMRRLGGVPAVEPDLEVQVRSVGVTGGADRAELLPGRHGLALVDQHRTGLHVHEDVGAAVVTGEDDVVAGAVGLVGAPVDRPG